MHHARKRVGVPYASSMFLPFQLGSRCTGQKCHGLTLGDMLTECESVLSLVIDRMAGLLQLQACCFQGTHNSAAGILIQQDPPPGTWLQ